MVNKVMIYLILFLGLSNVAMSQGLHEYAETNKKDTIKVKTFIKQSKVLKKEYKNVLICSCLNEYLKESVSKVSDSCVNAFPDLGSIVFNEKFYSQNLREINDDVLSKNIQQFNSEVVKFEIEKDKTNNEYNILQLPFLSRCTKIVNQYQPKYFRLLTKKNVSDLLPWLNY